jgi:nucleotide-binding universal stress UspA family protein
MRILIAYDGTLGADLALEDLMRAGLPANGEAHVLSVADITRPTTEWNSPADPANVPQVRSGAREAGRRALRQSREIAESAVGRLRTILPGWRCSSRVSADTPGRAIVEAAKDWPADMIVLGSHGRSTLQRFFLGSVSQRIAATAHCSVRVCRCVERPAHARPRILLGADGSPSSRDALQSVAARDWPSGTIIYVATVVDPHLQSIVGESDSFAEPWVEASDESQEWISRMAEMYRETLQRKGLTAEMHIFSGDPKHLLLEWAEKWDTDCVVLGASGFQHGGTELLGSVATAILTRAHCTVEITRATKTV